MLNLSCGGGHLGFLFDAKNLNVVIDHPITIIDVPFVSLLTEDFP